MSSPAQTVDGAASVEIAAPTPEAGAAAALAPAPRVHRRFDRLARLYGEAGVHRLMATRVVIFGVGGVGSFAAEALARSAVGHIRLVDFDDVCATNVNRQLQATARTVGKPKAALLVERLEQINPEAELEAVQEFYEPAHADALLTSPWAGPTGTFDWVLDCIDNLAAKAHLLATCRARGIPVVAAMGAGGKTDPTRVRVADLGRTDVCPLAQKLRKVLRQKYGFPRDRKKMGVIAVYSDEPRRWPTELAFDSCSTANCVCPRKDPRHSCDTRNLIDGTAGFVTGTFGLVCAAQVVNAVAGDPAQR